MIKECLLIGLMLSAVLCRIGIDIPNPQIVSPGLWQCIKTHGVDFLTARAYRSFGSVDPNVITNIKNARAAGIKEVDVYIFPCVSCANPRKQVTDTLANLKDVEFDKLWIDVEEYQWNKDKAVNREFLSQMLDEASKHVKQLGIYTNWHEWDAIVGRDWDAASKYLLWYPHWDHDPTFNDFRPFGGWTKPFRKQMTCDTFYCNEKFLVDYQPT